MQTQAEGPLAHVAEQFWSYLPTLAAGLLVLALGVFLGWLAKRALVRVLVLMRLDRLGGRVGWRTAFAKGDVRAALYDLVGGVAMFAGFLFGVLSLDAPLSHWRPLFAGGALLVIVGVLDDFRELSTRMRFAAQILAALLMVLWGGVEIKNLGALGWWGGVVGLGMFTIPLTVFAAVGVINAVNMSDGTDGLAGGLVLVALLCLLGVALATGRSPDSSPAA